MSEVTIIGNDLAKRVFQVHGARNDGSAVFRNKLSRGQVLAFFAQQPSCQPAVKRVTTPGERFGVKRGDRRSLCHGVSCLVKVLAGLIPRHDTPPSQAPSPIFSHSSYFAPEFTK